MNAICPLCRANNRLWRKLRETADLEWEGIGATRYYNTTVYRCPSCGFILTRQIEAGKPEDIIEGEK